MDWKSFLVLVPGRWAACWDSNPGPGFFCWWVKPLHGVGRAEIQGEVLLVIFNYIFIKKTV